MVGGRWLIGIAATRIALTPFLSKGETFADADQNGWDDRWEAAYPEIDTSQPMLDANGDGVPNLFELMQCRDPYAEPAEKPKAAEAPANTGPTAAQRLDWERRRTILAPYLNRGLRAKDDQPATRKSLRAEAADESRALAAQLGHDAKDAEKRKVAFLATPGGEKLPENLRASFRDVVDGHPIFDTALSHGQAISHGITNLWPGGLSGLGLTATGETVAMWDTGLVDPLHEQFGSGRVTNVDSGLYTDHAMAVAAVMMGAGDPADTNPGAIGFYPSAPRGRARGMAYQANIIVYDNDNDLTEMAGIGMGLMAGDHDIMFSNHSYGVAFGWQRILTGDYIIDNVNPVWNWFGNPTVGDGKSEHKLGLYMASVSDALDTIVYASPGYLPIFAAGNEGLNLTQIVAPDLAEEGYTETSPHKVVQTGFTYASAPIPPRKIDSDEFQGGTLVPQACAKNVLTVGASVGPSGGSVGPTDDLRFKPDLWAYGGYAAPNDYDLGATAEASHTGYRNISGSSYSSAVVTGGLALMRQRWKELRDPNVMVLASTWKALALAGPAGPFSQPNGYCENCPGVIPSKDRGYGEFHPEYSITITIMELDGDPAVAALHPRIKEITLVEGEVSEFRIVGRHANGFGQLGVLICWTDPPPDVNPPSDTVNPTQEVLRNDIDLRVIDRNEVEFCPYRQEGTLTAPTTTVGDNDRDNVELVHVDNPGAGEVFTVRISHKGTLRDGLQNVSVIMLNADALLAPPFRIIDFSRTGEHLFSLTWGSAVGAVYGIESSPDLDLDVWTPVSGEIRAAKELTCHEFDTSTHGPAAFYRVRQLW